LAGIYFHIPFCVTKCGYCDFYSETHLNLIDPLINTMQIEMLQRINYINEKNIETIYFGGGTPSLLNEKHFSRIFELLEQHYSIDNVREVTIECNPEDINSNFLCILKQFPFTRISLGTQSFNDNILQFLNRRHNANKNIEALEILSQFYEHIGCDIIFGIPGLSQQILKDTLNTISCFGIKHISAYELTYEPGTPIFKQLQNGIIKPTVEDDLIWQYEYIQAYLTSIDFQQYEISNYAKPGFQSRHNMNYWNLQPYIGIGPSAHSYDGQSRQWNVKNLHQYMNAIRQNKKYYDIEHLSTFDTINEYLLTSLRTVKGINVHVFKESFGEVMYKNLIRKCKRFIEDNTIAANNYYLKLTRKGLIKCDYVLENIIFE
jgi:putative oxygen-independent coproporphyrinogen III oxidase